MLVIFFDKFFFLDMADIFICTYTIVPCNNNGYGFYSRYTTDKRVVYWRAMQQWMTITSWLDPIRSKRRGRPRSRWANDIENSGKHCGEKKPRVATIDHQWRRPSPLSGVVQINLKKETLSISFNYFINNLFFSDTRRKPRVKDNHLYYNALPHSMCDFEYRCVLVKTPLI